MSRRPHILRYHALCSWCEREEVAPRPHTPPAGWLGSRFGDGLLACPDHAGILAEYDAARMERHDAERAIWKRHYDAPSATQREWDAAHRPPPLPAWVTRNGLVAHRQIVVACSACGLTQTWAQSYSRVASFRDLWRSGWRFRPARPKPFGHHEIALCPTCCVRFDAEVRPIFVAYAAERDGVVGEAYRAGRPAIDAELAALGPKPTPRVPPREVP